MPNAKAAMNGQEVELEDIEFLPGADPYSHDDICKNFFLGWTGKTPWGDVTWRIIHPDGFPRAEVWNGQFMLGGKLVFVNGASYRLDAVASVVDGKWQVRGSSSDPKMPWWLFPMHGHGVAKATEVQAAQDTMKESLEKACEAIIGVVDHDDALLWASAYAWALQNTRRSFNQLYNSGSHEALTRGEIRDEIEAALFRAEWSKAEIVSMVKHPRKEIRALATRIVMKISERREEEALKASSESQAATVADVPSPVTEAPLSVPASNGLKV